MTMHTVASEKNGVIQVQMLGGFAIRYGDKTLTESGGRTKKVWTLIEFLLANRGKDISQEKLIETLWADEECANPLNALKNLVYRARTTLKSLVDKGEKPVDFIKFERNTYAWNMQLACEVDAEHFEQLVREAEQSEITTQQRIDKYYEALGLYQGQFLPKSSFMDWVVVKDAFYSTLFNSCVSGLVKLLLQKNEYENAIRLCEYSNTINPYEEEIHQLLMVAYAKTGQQKKLTEHYQHVTELFYNEFGIGLLPETVSLYKSIVKVMHNVELDLIAIKDDLRETSENEGAFYCDYDIFKHIYRLQARSVRRTGYPAHIALITFTDLQGDIPKPEVIRQVMADFKKCITGSLRKGDVVSSYSSTQIVLMLPITTYEDGKKVINRVITNFEKTTVHLDIKISSVLSQVDPVESNR